MVLKGDDIALGRRRLASSRQHFSLIVLLLAGGRPLPRRSWYLVLSEQ